MHKCRKFSRVAMRTCAGRAWIRQTKNQRRSKPPCALYAEENEDFHQSMGNNFETSMNLACVNIYFRFAHVHCFFFFCICLLFNFYIFFHRIVACLIRVRCTTAARSRFKRSIWIILRFLMCVFYYQRSHWIGCSKNQLWSNNIDFSIKQRKLLYYARTFGVYRQSNSRLFVMVLSSHTHANWIELN